MNVFTLVPLSDPYVNSARVLLVVVCLLVTYLASCGLYALGELLGRFLLARRRRPVLEPEQLEDAS